MFNRKQPDPTPLDDAIADVYADLRGLDPHTKEYAKAMKALMQLESLKPKKIQAPSADTMIIAGANILGIGMIVGHERLSVITSKAINFVLKLR